MPTPTLGDLRYLYYGGGSAAEYDFLLNCYNNGITASAQLQSKVLGYAELTSSPATWAGAGVGNRTDISGLALAVQVGAKPINIVAHAGNVANNTANCGTVITVTDADTNTVLAQSYAPANPTVSIPASVRAEVGSLTVTPGLHSYKVQAFVTIGGTGSMNASATNKPFLRVMEL